MLHIDVFMHILILHCFHDYFSNQIFLVYIDDPINMFRFYELYHHYWMVQHSSFVYFFALRFSSALRSPLGVSMSPQDAPRAPSDLTRHSQGPPMTSQARPDVVIL